MTANQSQPSYHTMVSINNKSLPLTSTSLRLKNYFRRFQQKEENINNNKSKEDVEIMAAADSRSKEHRRKLLQQHQSKVHHSRMTTLVNQINNSLVVKNQDCKFSYHTATSTSANSSTTVLMTMPVMNAIVNGLAFNKNLQRVQIEAQMSPKMISMLAIGLKQSKAIIKLNLSRCWISDSELSALLLTSMYGHCELQELDLSYNRANIKTMQALNTISSHQDCSIKSLNLRWQQVRGPSFHLLANGILNSEVTTTELECLDLSCNEIQSNHDFECLCRAMIRKSSKNNNVQKWILSDCGMTNGNLEILAQYLSSSFCSITTLDLGGQQLFEITSKHDFGILTRLQAALKENKSLKTLILPSDYLLAFELYHYPDLNRGGRQQCLSYCYNHDNGNKDNCTTKTNNIPPALWANIFQRINTMTFENDQYSTTISPDTRRANILFHLARESILLTPR